MSGGADADPTNPEPTMYAITTIENHSAAIEIERAKNLARVDLDVSDSATSTWATSQLIAFHAAAIKALNLGAANGINGPAAEHTFLVDADGNIAGRACETRFGMAWRLLPTAARRAGRDFVPMGAGSRVQARLGLREEARIVAVKREFVVSCAFVGAPMSFETQPA